MIFGFFICFHLACTYTIQVISDRRNGRLCLNYQSRKNAPTVIVAAVTSVIKKRYLPSHIILGDKFGLKKPSIANDLNMIRRGGV